MKICLHNRILPRLQVAQNQITLNLSDLLRRQDFHRHSPAYTKRFVAATCRAIRSQSCTKGLTCRPDELQ